MKLARNTIASNKDSGVVVESRLRGVEVEMAGNLVENNLGGDLKVSSKRAGRVISLALREEPNQIVEAEYREEG